MRPLAALTLPMLVTVLAACSPRHTASVKNPSEPTVITLAAEPDKQVVSLEIRGIGSIDGSAEIALMVDGKAYRSEQLKGAVSFTWAGDWYSPSAEIHYRPSRVLGGKLDLKYRFGTL